MSRISNPKLKCEIADCLNLAQKGRLCAKHYSRFRRYGDPNKTVRKPREANLGQAEDPLYKTWWYMICRCEYKKHPSYDGYGGRGIAVCRPWRQSFLTFREYILNNLGPKPPGHYLDRIENDENYKPGNVKWSTSKASAANRRTRSDAHWITFNGETKLLTEWAKSLEISHTALINRFKRGLPLEKALTSKFIPQKERQLGTQAVFLEYKGERKPLVYWANQLGISRERLYHRIHVHKWSIEKALTTPVIPRSSLAKN